jgi:hypothetical protein
LRTSFIHHQSASAHVGAVRSCDRSFRSSIVSELNKGKAAWLSGVAVAHQSDAVELAVLAKHGFQVRFACAKRQIAYIQLLHCASCEVMGGERRSR